MGIAYGEDIEKAKQILLECITNTPKVLSEPAPLVGVKNFGDSSVNLTIMSYCNGTDFWDVYFGGNENIKKALDAAGIEIPFRKRQDTAIL